MLRRVLTTALILVGLTTSLAHAQTPQDCATLMQYGIYDRYRTFATEEQFKLVQNFFKEYHFASRQEAEAKAGTLGLNLLDILSVDLGGQSSSKNFSQWVSNLVSSNYSQFSSSSSMAQTLDVISARITALVGDCLNRNDRKGLHAYLVPAKDHLNFVYNLAFIPSNAKHPASTGTFTITPATVAATCSPAKIVGEPQTVGPQGLAISCRRLANETVTIVAKFDEGSPTVRYDAFEILPPFALLEPKQVTIESGASATLRWTVSNAESATLSPGFGSVQSTGTVAVYPTKTQQYTLTAKGLDGKLVNDFATVEVKPPPLVLTGASVSFHTNDEDRDHNTNETIYVRCSGETVALASGTFGNRKFSDDSNEGPFSLAVTAHPRLESISTCQFRIDQSPKGNDTWRFNVHLTLVFSNGETSQSKNYDFNGQELKNISALSFDL
ncbi:MAG: hypothetical protein QM765_30755 [Myxococcales bacterium]